jgi:hypothetical protein
MAESLNPKRYCLEELTRKHGDNTDTIDRLYSPTAENVCLKLKHHVSMCLDRALYSISSRESDKNSIPNISTRELYKVLKTYVNVKNIPGMEDAIENCAHVDEHSGMYNKVISVGDFTKRCECDFSGVDDCVIYKRISQVLQCGRVIE